MARDLAFHRFTRADLFGIDDIIEERSGPARAGRCLDRIEKACQGLTECPDKGRPRDDVSAGFRTWALERRALMPDRMTREHVEVLRVLSGGRDFRADDIPH